MKFVAGVIGVGLIIVGVVMFSTRRPSASHDGSVVPAAQWSVSKMYTVDNHEVPGMVGATVDSSDGENTLDVRCSKGFSAAYFRPHDAPAPEVGTETATYVSSLDDGPESVGHARVDGRSMDIGNALFVSALAKARRLQIKYTPLMEHSLSTVDFDLRGLQGALNEMGAVCGQLQ
jgi:hypothetical protein